MQEVGRDPGGERGALEADALFRDLYGQLKSLAAGYMRRQRSAHTLQATALVHEAYLRLSRQDPERWESRGHMMAVAGRAMRSVLVDHARGRRRDKRRADGLRVSLDGLVEHLEQQSVDMLDLDDALSRLETEGPEGVRAARVIELRFFCGLTMPEVAESLGIALRTAERDYRFARDWLRQQLR